MLLMLLITLILVSSNRDNSSRLSSMLSTSTHAGTPAEDEIGQMISAIEEQEVYTPTFEDALPEPMFQKAAAPVEVVAEKRHLMGLIIDDVGYSMKAMRRLVQLPFAVNVAILPDSPYAKESAQMAYQHGLTVMLHMPMQTSNPKYQQKMERSYLHKDMSKDEFISAFEEALAKVPHVQGVNNHMGSLLTENKQAMQWMMELCKKHNLFFIDSRTSSKSVAASEADQAQIFWNQRDVFLDHSVEAAALEHAWSSALHCTETSDHCIVLGHPHPETLDFLEHGIHGLGTQFFVPIRQILKD